MLIEVKTLQHGLADKHSWTQLSRGPTEIRKKGVLFFLMITFQRNGFQVLEKDTFGVEILEGNLGGGYLMYHIPMGRSMDNASKSLQAFVSFSKITEMLKDSVRGEDILIQLSVGDASCFFKNDEYELTWLSSNEAENLISDRRKNLSESHVEVYGIELNVFNDSTETFSAFNSLRNMNILILFLGVSLSAGLSLWLSVDRLSKVRFLADSIKNSRVQSENKKRRYESEFDYLQEVLNTSIKEKSISNENVRKYREALLRHVSMLIFHGIIRDEDEVRTALRLCKTDLFEKYFYICGFKLENAEAVDRLNELLKNDIYYVYESNYVFIISELPSIDKDMEVRHKVMINLLDLFSEFNINCKQIFVSQVYDKVEMISYGCMEVLGILESTGESNKQLVFQEEWMYENKKLSVIKGNEHLNIFLEAVLQKNYAKAEDNLKKILKRDSENRERYMYSRFLVLQVLISSLSISEKESEQTLLEEINNIDLYDESSFERDVLFVLQKCCQKAEEKSYSFEEVLQFVEDNFNRPELSLDLVAEYAGVTKSAISKMFKRKLDITYADYVMKLRMEKAKELLMNTDMAVKHIFSEVGYVDVVTARRNFKAYFNTSATTFRENIKGEDNK